MPKVLHVVSARPNFPKVAPIHRVIARRGSLEQRVVHTGQHYDPALSEVFLADLGLPPPDFALDTGSGSHAEQTARTLLGLEDLLDRFRPDLLTVVGDTNGALAAALAAAKAQVRVAHVEAGLRSFDRRMPEEVNRVVIDHLADLHLTPSPDAGANLLREGIDPSRVHHVGNVMIDTLLHCLDLATARAAPERFGLTAGGYAVSTLHRPSTVDDPVALAALLGALAGIAERLPVVLPVHPRTERTLRDPRAQAVLASAPGLRLLPPLGYLDFLSLTARARLVLTDSGGLQEETTVLGVPCLTLRENTERPITVEQGTNTVVGVDPDAVLRAAHEALDRPPPAAVRPELWDGHAAERVVDVYERELGLTR
ncbi:MULTISPECIES: non-hydrolyzing UDP-N-acetylglucosamine 2-epimerase [Actinosynnema]|uniref:non-hydrolyzing UDP-N-acetylglucosamine 2-epimerase n=1 Tax=Actinosynnema TaxID=40566 RepID=UPI0020A551E4|nr:UDP-N-acetylglucosamine 2-epimerase (non-hydrolyzing) [Actinosynnema pretiosum]MCP2098818.1 UDP-N-acetylglucosamine 2-epimerase (non-hydrolyzing) [Actinosynnema pretiosum]